MVWDVFSPPNPVLSLNLTGSHSLLRSARSLLTCRSLHPASGQGLLWGTERLTAASLPDVAQNPLCSAAVLNLHWVKAACFLSNTTQTGPGWLCRQGWNSFVFWGMSGKHLGSLCKILIVNTDVRITPSSICKVQEGSSYIKCGHWKQMDFTLHYCFFDRWVGPWEVSESAQLKETESRVETLQKLIKIWMNTSAAVTSGPLFCYVQCTSIDEWKW